MSTLEVVVDDEARIRILHPDAHAQSCLVQHSCSTFQSKLHDFHTLVKELLEQVSEQAHKIENAKLCAVGTRNLVSAEVETRPRILRDQHNIISDKQDQLQRLTAEYESLQTVKHEQEVIIAQLTHSSLPV
ncbi:unnamed protein product [Sphagnum troendelagicum]|uniref:Intraflagellar transport protein 20 n=2 Tax=Sphagnum TaxID=13804 RepID=A0ABP0TKG5_9BRYO